MALRTPTSVKSSSPTHLCTCRCCCLSASPKNLPSPLLLCFDPLHCSPPAADAVKSAEAQLSGLSKAQLKDVLRYHIVPAALSIPAQLQADKAYPTAFTGHNLRFKYNKWVWLVGLIAAV